MATGNQSTGTLSNEWYTPGYVFDIVDTLYGKHYDIQLDWYTSEKANQTVGANYIFTKDNPFVRYQRVRFMGSEYRGWCNPPYTGDGHPIKALREILEFLDQYILGECFLLLNANMETQYSQLAMTHCKALYFFNKRIPFIDGKTGKPRKNNSKGQVLYYFATDKWKRLLNPCPKHGLLICK